MTKYLQYLLMNLSIDDHEMNNFQNDSAFIDFVELSMVIKTIPIAELIHCILIYVIIEPLYV